MAQSRHWLLQLVPIELNSYQPGLAGGPERAAMSQPASLQLAHLGLNSHAFPGAAMLGAIWCSLLAVDRTTSTKAAGTTSTLERPGFFSGNFQTFLQ